MPTYTNNNRNSNGTSNLMHLLDEKDYQVLQMIRPRDLEKVFGRGEDVDIPEKGYTDPEWYWTSSDGNVWGIGWRWGRTRLRGRGATQNGNSFFFDQPSPEKAADFVRFINESLEGK
tara:strand:- start:360 stop:710 length:351 start_codon:yes stop_codon:yes gene_type:complete